MSESAGNNSPANPAPSYKKEKMKPKFMIITAVLVVVALVAGMLIGGFVLNQEEDVKGGVLEKIISSGELVVGTNTPWPPFEDYDAETDTYIGVDMDIVKRIAAELDVTLVIKQMDFDALIGAVQAGQIDIAISSFTITAARMESVDFSTPYYIANQAVLVQDDSTVNSTDDLNGLNVGAQLGTTGNYWIEDELDSTTTVSTYPDIASAVIAVDTGIADAVVLDHPVAEKYANSTAYDLKVAFYIPTDEHYGIVIPKDNAGLKNVIDAIILEMLNDGSMDDIIDLWT
ncbi:MAG: transporter substrate-binding domain-containing protein [Euryarchaeota archaeon]|nr:transporter substrate-binding domain-containing protein [Euryarchaeota archaeon]